MRIGQFFKRKIHICLAGERTFLGLWRQVRITREPPPPLQYPLQGIDVAPTVDPVLILKGLVHEIECKYIGKS